MDTGVARWFEMPLQELEHIRLDLLQAKYVAVQCLYTCHKPIATGLPRDQTSIRKRISIRFSV